MITDSDDETERDEIVRTVQQIASDKKAFFDITTMLVYVSDVCNGGNFYDFREKVLEKQAVQEKQKSALATILTYMEDKTLVTCQSALDDFNGIVSILGGPEERIRSEKLAERLTVVPDCMSPRFANLTESGQIRSRSKVIFGSADTLKCSILTSNEGFVRAAAGQGIHISTMIHEPRALTEQKRIKIVNEMSKQ